MTPKQKEQFNKMRTALRTISKDFVSPARIHRMTDTQRHGLDPDDYMEMAYENIQGIAENAVRGVREVK
ncbi:hypothetical protein [Alcaligenes ammonioxydans]|uniref:hypothetical protein n=1 Tax=Alcaligenes ammonioxydans TaxID=2582914 RepID=UPI003D1A15FB